MTSQVDSVTNLIEEMHEREGDDVRRCPEPHIAMNPLTTVGTSSNANENPLTRYNYGTLNVDSDLTPTISTNEDDVASPYLRPNSPVRGSMFSPHLPPDEPPRTGSDAAAELELANDADAATPPPLPQPPGRPPKLTGEEVCTALGFDSETDVLRVNSPACLAYARDEFFSPETAHLTNSQFNERVEKKRETYRDLHGDRVGFFAMKDFSDLRVQKDLKRHERILRRREAKAKKRAAATAQHNSEEKKGKKKSKKKDDGRRELASETSASSHCCHC